MDALAAVAVEMEAAGDEEVWAVEVVVEGLVAGVVLHRDPTDRLRVNTVRDEEQTGFGGAIIIPIVASEHTHLVEKKIATVHEFSFLLSSASATKNLLHGLNRIVTYIDLQHNSLVVSIPSPSTGCEWRLEGL